MRYHLTPVRMAIIKKTTSVGEDVKKRKPLCSVGGNVNWCSPYGKRMEVPQKIKNTTTLSSNFTPGYFIQRK